MARRWSKVPSFRQQEQSCRFLELPVEVRHSIYKYLFCHESSPIWIGNKYMGLGLDGPSEPTFYTQIFRANRKISLESISFAYGANSFELRDNFPAFCNLGPVALAAIKNLTVVHSSWRAETEAEDRIWQVIKESCSSLVYLNLDLHSDLVLQAVPYLQNFMATISTSNHRPKILLDLYVWERHFSFDPANRDYNRIKLFLQKRITKSPSTPHFTDPLTRVLRFPTHVEQLVLSADVTLGAVDALDDFLSNSMDCMLRKTAHPVPQHGHRASGRSIRLCYHWADDEGEQHKPMS